MLTTCRALMGEPELIMSDEPTGGLAPSSAIARIAEAGVSTFCWSKRWPSRSGFDVIGYGRIVFSKLEPNDSVRKE